MMKELINKSVYIIREAYAQFKNPIVLWSTGKDSTTCLYLIKTALGDIPFPVVHLDTTYKFREMYEFRDRVSKELVLNLDVVVNESDKTPHQSRFECCSERKTLALKNYVIDNGIDAVIVAIRRDEHPARNKSERFFSPRKGDFSYIFWDQPPEFWDLFQTEYYDASHVRVHPMLHWTVENVWQYVKENNIPVNPLYFKGFSSLGCEPCTKPTLEPSKTLDEFIDQIKAKRWGELEGRSQDKEEQYMMEKLRALGYM